MTTEVLGNPVQAEPESEPWIPTDDTFGARLALIRQKMGWGNIKEAALACGLPPESWRTWERDGVVPRDIRQKSARISDRTGCDYGWLLDGRRLAGVYRPIRHTDQGGSPRHEASVRKTTVTARSDQKAYPDRVRPGDHRPSGHPKLLPPPPNLARPVRIRRAA